MKNVKQLREVKPIMRAGNAPKGESGKAQSHTGASRESGGCGKTGGTGAVHTPLKKERIEMKYNVLFAERKNREEGAA